jgi:hypothetical protein
VIGHHAGALTWQLVWISELRAGELAEPEVAAPALSEAGHHGEVPGEVVPLESAAHFEEVLEAEGLFFAVVVQRPHLAEAAGHKEFEAGFGARKGLVHLGQRRDWGRLDAEPACWEQERVLSQELAHIWSMAPRTMLRVAAGREMRRGELEDHWEWAMWSWWQKAAVHMRSQQLKSASGTEPGREGTRL